MGVTQLTSSNAQVSVLASGTSLDTAVPALVIGCEAGARAPPTASIMSVSGAQIDAETAGTYRPDTDGLAFYESLEGMRVLIRRPVVVGPANAFGEVPVVASQADGRYCATAAQLTSRGGIIIDEVAGDFNPERMLLDVSGATRLKVGDVLGDVDAIVDYSGDNYKFVGSKAPTVISSPLTPSPPLGLVSTPGVSVTLASINAENLDPGDPDDKFARLASAIVSGLGSPDIIGLVEVQDNTGEVNDGEVACDSTIAKLNTFITAAGGASYAFRTINPVDGQDGGEPGGNIRNVLLYNAARVTFVDRGSAGSTTANSVQADAGGKPQLQYSPGRIDPTNTAFRTSRKSIAFEVVVNGQKLFIVLNHFNSKGGDQPLFGRYQPPARSSETKRNHQSGIVAAFVQSILALDASANVAVMGDLNDFIGSDVLNALYVAGLTNAYSLLTNPAERYSYNFEGNAQALDHILLSPSLITAGAELGVLHVNSEFPATAPSRFSDHDPLVVRIALRPRSSRSPPPSPPPPASLRQRPPPSKPPPKPSPSRRGSPPPPPISRRPPGRKIAKSGLPCPAPCRA